MRVVLARPPLFAEIDAAFQIAGRPVIFAWGDAIYNPEGGAVAPELHAHEEVHGMRQGAHPAAWWRMYIADPAFRLAEEIPAHQAEFRKLCNTHRAQWTSERNMRRTFAAHVARKLSAPLYGRLITFEAAKKTILAAA